MKLNIKLQNACPYCGKTAMSFFKKMLVGPGSDTKCGNCGKRIGINSYAMYIGVLFLLFFFIVMQETTSNAVQVISFVLLSLIYGTMLNIFFPLIKKDIY